jgi:hypothetical protein
VEPGATLTNELQVSSMPLAISLPPPEDTYHQASQLDVSMPVLYLLFFLSSPKQQLP